MGPMTSEGVPLAAAWMSVAGSILGALVGATVGSFVELKASSSALERQERQVRLNRVHASAPDVIRAWSVASSTEVDGHPGTFIGEEGVSRLYMLKVTASARAPHLAELVETASSHPNQHYPQEAFSNDEVGRLNRILAHWIRDPDGFESEQRCLDEYAIPQ